jgi:hypothetical protein
MITNSFTFTLIDFAEKTLGKGN